MTLPVVLEQNHIAVRQSGEKSNALLQFCNRAFLHRGIPTYFVMRFLKNLLER